MSKDALIGNLYEQPFDEIWNSKKAIEIRKKALNACYEYCYIPFCISKSNYNIRLVPPQKDTDFKPKQKSYPKMVCIGADAECNASCIMCRSGIYRMSDDELETAEKRIKELYIPILKDAKWLTLSTTADPFASRNTRLLMKTAAETYPDLKFNLITNGILCDKFNCDDVGITDRLSRVMVSIHAATEDTYNKVVKHGNFKKVQENLEWLKTLVDEKKLGQLFMAFVISSKNYQDIPLFEEFAKKYNAIPLYWGCIDWGGNLSNSDEPLNITDPSHPKHQELLNILNSLDNKDIIANFAPPIRNLLRRKEDG